MIKQSELKANMLQQTGEQSQELRRIETPLQHAAYLLVRPRWTGGCCETRFLLWFLIVQVL